MSKPPILQDRIAKAAKVMKITEDALWAKLNKLGICKEDDDALALIESETTREGDVRKVFCDDDTSTLTPGALATIPVIRFLAGWAVLRGRGETKESQDSSDVAKIVEAIKPLTQYSDKDLLQRYSPDCSSEILDELRKRSHDNPFIVFNDGFNDDGETIDVENTFRLLKIARRNERVPATYLVTRDGKDVMIRLYRLGEFPMMWLEECPVHPEVILVEGYCERCQCSWEGVSATDRIIVRVAVDLKAVDVSSLGKIFELVKTIKTEKNAQSLLQIPAVNLKYKELQEEGRLPILRRRISSTANGKKDPLYVHKSY